MLGADLSARRPVAQAFLPLVIAILSCTISAVLTVRLCLELRDSSGVLSAGIAVGLGILWELGKITFAPVGLRLVTSDRSSDIAAGLALCCLAAVLVAGSVAASIGYLVQADGRRQAEATHASRKYQDRQAQIEMLDQQLRALTRAATSDQDAGYRTRAAAALAQVEELRRERIRVTAELEGMDGATGLVSESGVFLELGAVFSGDATKSAARLRFLANALIAVVLELLSIAAVWLLRARADAPVHLVHSPHPDATGATDAPPGTRPASPPIMMAMPSVSPVVAVQAHPPHPGTMNAAADAPIARVDSDAAMYPDAKSATNAPSDTRYQRARELVAARAIDPSYRALQHSLRLGQTTARRFLDAMTAEGLVCREGRRFAVAGMPMTTPRA